jgi:hypothetical protein
MNKPNTAAAILNPNHAFLVGLPKKSKYQFFVRTTTRSAVAQVIRTELPTVATGKKETDPRKALIFGYDHPYVGWAGFNLPGTFEIRKKLAGMFFRQGFKWGVAVELEHGGLSPMTNRHDHTGCREIVNTGGCAGCENKNPENCGPCTMEYKYRYDGTKVPKTKFDRNTIWKKEAVASV